MRRAKAISDDPRYTIGIHTRRIYLPLPDAVRELQCELDMHVNYYRIIEQHVDSRPFTIGNNTRYIYKSTIEVCC